MSFKSFVIGLCDRFVSQRAFDLIVTPALADLEFEEAGGRRSPMASRAAVLRAIAGGIAHDMRNGSGGFLKLTLLSACYYVFPVAVSVRIFKTWEGFLLTLAVVLGLSLIPVMVCFWPVRSPVRHGD